MSIEIKKLMNTLLEKFGGMFKRENQRTYWVSPKEEKYHANTKVTLSGREARA